MLDRSREQKACSYVTAEITTALRGAGKSGEDGARKARLFTQISPCRRARRRVPLAGDHLAAGGAGRGPAGAGDPRITQRHL